MAKLTREEMEAVIANRGSVMYKGRIIREVKNLPSRAELAAGDPVAEAKTREHLEARIAELEAEKAKLGQAAPAETAVSPEDEVLAGNVEQVRAYVATVTDVEELARLVRAETDREVPRKGVFAAIETRTAELEAGAAQ